MSSDGQSIVAGPRSSSVAGEAKHTRESSEQLSGAFNSPIRDPYLSLVRPSPSSPADLANIAQGRMPPTPLTRPLTHIDREPVTARRPPMPLILQTDKRRSGVFERSRNVDDDWLEANEDRWSPMSPAESGRRPFSFAMRAGATASRGSSDGHGGRRSLWGRWGGSVTSLFGGSQGGSGSMIDMQ